MFNWVVNDEKKKFVIVWNMNERNESNFRHHIELCTWLTTISWFLIYREVGDEWHDKKKGIWISGDDDSDANFGSRWFTFLYTMNGSYQSCDDEWTYGECSPLGSPLNVRPKVKLPRKSERTFRIMHAKNNSNEDFKCRLCIGNIAGIHVRLKWAFNFHTSTISYDFESKWIKYRWQCSIRWICKQEKKA